MKRKFLTLVCAVLAVIMITSAATFAFAAKNEPTTEEMERMIKLVKPRLDIPEEASEFSWNYNAAGVYNDARWIFSWRTESGDASYIASCDTDGHILSYIVNLPYTKTSSEGIVPSATKEEYKDKADAYIAKLNPEAKDSFTFVRAYAGSTRTKTYTYEYVRTENGYSFPENTVSVTLSYIDGSLRRYSINYNYDAMFEKPEKVIGEEKAKELLSTKQSMKLCYITDYETTDEKTVAKALLVYAPEKGYASVDAVTGEIYDTVSSWEVRKGDAGGASDATSNKNMNFDASLSEEAVEDAEYELSESELAQKEVLAKLIPKDDAIKAVTGNKYLLINEALTAVDAYLRKNYQDAKSYYQDDSGSYTWNIELSNPVLSEGEYYDYAWINASVNADNGKLVSFNASLRDRFYYEKSGTPLPEVKYSEEEAQKIAEDFLKAECKDKFDNAVLSSSNEVNIISYKDADSMTEPVYGAYSFRYVRVFEGVEYPANSISIGVDGVTGKVYRFSTRWNTNIEFESPEKVISPEKALEVYVNLGTDIRYEKNTTYIYTPVNAASKKDISKAFIYSLFANIENGGDIDKVIDKYAKDIDREKLGELIKSGDENALLAFIEEYYGVEIDTDELSEGYKDLSDFYSKEEEIRLVYLVDAGSTAYIDAFDEAALDYSGNPVKTSSDGYSYSDISGHWAERTIALLGEIGIGFEGGSFEPDKAITGKEFCKLASSLSFSLWNSDKPIYSLKDSDEAALRIDGVKYVLTCIDYDKVAVLENIFRTEFLDNAQIKEGDIGYIAIAHALGIVKGNGETMRTYDVLTRAEALTMLVNAATAVK